MYLLFITRFRKDEFGLLLGIEKDNTISPAGVMLFMNTAAKKQFYNLHSHLIIDENRELSEAAMNIIVNLNQVRGQ